MREHQNPCGHKISLVIFTLLFYPSCQLFPLLNSSTLLTGRKHAQFFTLLLLDYKFETLTSVLKKKLQLFANSQIWQNYCKFSVNLQSTPYVPRFSGQPFLKKILQRKRKHFGKLSSFLANTVNKFSAKNSYFIRFPIIDLIVYGGSENKCTCPRQ